MLPAKISRDQSTYLYWYLVKPLQVLTIFCWSVFLYHYFADHKHFVQLTFYHMYLVLSTYMTLRYTIFLQNDTPDMVRLQKRESLFECRFMIEMRDRKRWRAVLVYQLVHYLFVVLPLISIYTIAHFVVIEFRFFFNVSSSFPFTRSILKLLLDAFSRNNF